MKDVSALEVIGIDNVSISFGPGKPLEAALSVASGIMHNIATFSAVCDAHPSLITDQDRSTGAVSRCRS